MNKAILSLVAIVAPVIRQLRRPPYVEVYSTTYLPELQ
jgi:hypothetical protein